MRKVNDDLYKSWYNFHFLITPIFGIYNPLDMFDQIRLQYDFNIVRVLCKHDLSTVLASCLFLVRSEEVFNIANSLLVAKATLEIAGRGH